MGSGGSWGLTFVDETETALRHFVFGAERHVAIQEGHVRHGKVRCERDELDRGGKA